MANETIRLAEYAAGLRYEDLPSQVIQRAKDCIIDTVAVIVLGNALPWSQIISRYAQSIGGGGRSRCCRRLHPRPVPPSGQRPPRAIRSTSRASSSCSTVILPASTCPRASTTSRMVRRSFNACLAIAAASS